MDRSEAIELGEVISSGEALTEERQAFMCKKLARRYALQAVKRVWNDGGSAALRQLFDGRCPRTGRPLNWGAELPQTLATPTVTTRRTMTRRKRRTLTSLMTLTLASSAMRRRRRLKIATRRRKRLERRAAQRRRRKPRRRIASRSRRELCFATRLLLRRRATR